MAIIKTRMLDMPSLRTEQSSRFGAMPLFTSIGFQVKEIMFMTIKSLINFNHFMFYGLT